MKIRLLLPLALAPFCLPAEEFAYQKPAKPILDILHAPSLPSLSVNPTRTHAVLSQSSRYPPISEVAAPMVRIAGLRIDPKTNGIHLAPINSNLTLKRLSDGKEVPVTLPAGGRFSSPHWAPDGKHFAFTNTTANSIELWLCEAETGKARRIDGVKLNAVLGDPIDWLDDSKTILLKTVSTGRGAVPVEPVIPKGPKVQEANGRSGPVRTYEDMLASPHDEDLFDYYATAQLLMLDIATNKTTPMGKPAIFQAVTPSPDGKDFLIERVHKPYSYLHPYNDFPREVEIWDRNAKVAFKVASLGLADRVPIEGVRPGPRNYQWKTGDAATMMWVEALDGGNPKEKVPNRDRVVVLPAPFTTTPREILKTEHRFRGMRLTPDGKTALVDDFERERRWVRTFEVDLKNPGAAPKVLFSRNQQDRYKDPGTPVMKGAGGGGGFGGGGGRGGDVGGERAIWTSGDNIFLNGLGASKEGDRPFLDKFNLVTGQSERLFHSAADCYEQVVAMVAADGTKVITRRESPTDPPNYFLKTLPAGPAIALTRFKDPAPQLRRVTKQLVTYKRPDGVPLSFTLYLPPDYKQGTRLPTVVWAYPREFNDADTAGQISGSTQRFTSITGPSHLFFLMLGYAILDDAAMPVVGTPEKVNDTYIDQVVADAKAAIDKGVEMGVVDPARVGVGGHSYGAFMTANLLAHSDLFKAGIARSGAYNRTLTPFGFQSERRTLWEARDVYLNMSPFLYADKIKEPILLIHGEADNNQGTFPIQSERMYHAIRGNGGILRYVVLPSESHGYQAKESIEHTLWEMTTWFEKHVKGASHSASGTR